MTTDFYLNDEENMKEMILQLTKKQEAMIGMIEQMSKELEQKKKFSLPFTLSNPIKKVRSTLQSPLIHKKETIETLQNTAHAYEEKIKEKSTENIKKINDKFKAFKNLVGFSLVNLTQKFGYKSEEKNWYNIGHKVGLTIHFKKGQAKELYESSLKSFKKITDTMGVLLQTTKEKTEDLKENINLIGDKKAIVHLQKNFSDILNILGFNANDLYHETKKNHYASEEDIMTKINEELNTLHFSFENGRYTNDFIKNLDDEGKARTIHSVLWPNLAEKIKEGMSLTSTMADFIKTNKYLNMISEFAKKNNMTAEDVTNILEVDPDAFEPKHILYQKPGFDKMKTHYYEIMENIHKFSILAKNNHMVMAIIVKATEDLKDVITHLNIEDERKKQLLDSIDESNVFKDQSGHIYKYKTIRKNISSIIENQAKSYGVKSDNSKSSIDSTQTSSQTDIEDIDVHQPSTPSL